MKVKLVLASTDFKLFSYPTPAALYFCKPVGSTVDDGRCDYCKSFSKTAQLLYLLVQSPMSPFNVICTGGDPEFDPSLAP
jgi:hypothetical protein